MALQVRLGQQLMKWREKTEETVLGKVGWQAGDWQIQGTEKVSMAGALRMRRGIQGMTGGGDHTGTS